jgi:hypothetical protein
MVELCARENRPVPPQVLRECDAALAALVDAPEPEIASLAKMASQALFIDDDLKLSYIRFDAICAAVEELRFKAVVAKDARRPRPIPKHQGLR